MSKYVKELMMDQLRSDLDGTVADAGAPGRDPEFGFGVVDLQLLK